MTTLYALFTQPRTFRRSWTRKIADIGLYEYRRQLEYKAKLSGAELVRASRWFPSGMCSVWPKLKYLFGATDKS
jgi:hypothetical protein